VINKTEKFYKLQLFCLEAMLKSINYKCICQSKYVPKKTLIFLKKLYVSMINAISYWTWESNPRDILNIIEITFVIIFLRIF